jgi:hypothetical protein
MLAEARQALLAHRIGQDPRRWLSAEDVLLDGDRWRRGLPRDVTTSGSLETGKAADLVMIDTRRLSTRGASSDPLAALVFSPFPEPADTGHRERAHRGGRGRAGRRGCARAGRARADAISERMLRQASRTTGKDYFRRTAGPWDESIIGDSVVSPAAHTRIPRCSRAGFAATTGRRASRRR